MTIQQWTTAFVDAVDLLISSGEKIYVFTNNGKYINFRGDDFKRALRKFAKEEEYLKYFRTLEWIITEKERLTNTQKIQGKTMRVITIDYHKYELLKNNIEK